MVLLIVFGPDARTVQTSYTYDSFQVGSLIVDASKLYAGAAAICSLRCCSCSFATRWSGKSVRACADNYNRRAD